MNEAKPYTSRGTPEVRVRRSAGCSETWYPGGKNGKVRILCSNFVRVSVSFWAGFCFLVSAEDRRARRTAQAGRPCHCEEWIRTDNQNVAGNAMFTWNFVSVGLSFTSLAWYNRPGWMGVSNFLFFFILKFLSLRQVLFVFDLWTRPPPLPPRPLLVRPVTVLEPMFLFPLVPLASVCPRPALSWSSETESLTHNRTFGSHGEAARWKT